MNTIKVYKSRGDGGLPNFATSGSAGADIRANMLAGDKEMVPGVMSYRFKGFSTINDEIHIGAGGRASIHTGLHVAVPKGYELEIRPRSGLAMNHGITLINSPGTIDADYRGEIICVLVNHGIGELIIKHNDRIAQMLLKEVNQFEWEVCKSIEALGDTDRGESGFGSTGVK